MPVRPLPNELIVLVFEHLFRLLSVHPAEEFLDVPEAAPFVFGRLCQVSKTWHHLAARYVVQHLGAEELIRVRDAAPNKLEGLRSAKWRDSEAARGRAAKSSQSSWTWAAEASAATIQQLWFGAGFEIWAFSALFCTARQSLPALRRLTLNASKNHNFDCFYLLSHLATQAPQLEHLTLISIDRFLIPPPSNPPAWQLANLRVLDLRDFHFKYEWLRPILVDGLVRPSRETLEYLFLDVAVWHHLGEPFSTLFPFTLPNLLALRCPSRDIDCESLDIAAALPRIVDLTVSLPGPSPSLPAFPSSLRHLEVAALRRDTFAQVVEQLHATLDSSTNSDENLASSSSSILSTELAVGHLRTLGLAIAGNRSLGSERETAAIPALRCLVAACSARGITVHSDQFAHYGPKTEIFQAMGEKAGGAEVDKDDDENGTVDEDDEEEEEGEEEEDITAVVLPLIPRWPVPKLSDEEWEALEDQREKERIEEEARVVRIKRGWSAAKRAQFEADSVFRTLPDASSHFTSLEALETVKAAFAERLERVLKEEEDAWAEAELDSEADSGEERREGWGWEEEEENEEIPDWMAWCLYGGGEEGGEDEQGGDDE
ncbi:hypothetical protein JCM6882_009217 [Rhodosporidiobolus microsporus]